MSTRGTYLAVLALALAPLGCGSPDEADAAQASEMAASPALTSISAPGGTFRLELATATFGSNLADALDIPVTISPSTHVTAVDLEIVGLPPGVVATPTTVVVSGKEVTARVRVTVDATAWVTPKNTTVPISIVARAGDEKAIVAADFKVNPYIVIRIPQNIAALYQAPGGPLRDEWGTAFGPNYKPLRTQPGNPITVAIFNGDGVKHILHGPGGTFPHGDFGSPILPGEFEMLGGAIRPRTVKIGDNVTAYIHGEYYSQNAAFKITVAPTQ